MTFGMIIKENIVKQKQLIVPTRFGREGNIQFLFISRGNK